MDNNITPAQIIGFGAVLGQLGSRPYRGYWDENRFVIRRIVWFRNVFRPEITGSVEGDARGTSVKVEMKLNALVKAFCIIWLTGVILGTCLAIPDFVSSAAFTPTMLIPPGMLFFFFLTCWGSFKLAASRDKEKLCNIMKAQIEE